MEIKPLSRRIKLGYGVGDLGGNLFFTIGGFYLLNYLTDTVRLFAALAGTALMIGKFWDAVTDPAMGYLSDRTVHPWGRRRPYIFWGSISLFLTMILLFLPPNSGNQGLLFFWAAGMYCLVCTAYTLVNIPYGALAPELTPDYYQRTVLNGYRQLFAVIGTLVGAGLVLPLVGAFGWTAMGAVMGGIMMASALITFFTVKEPARQGEKLQPGIFRSYFSALGQGPFLLALIPWSLHITGVTVIQSALLYYFKYIYRNEGFFQVALLILLVTSLIFIPIWVRVSRRIGKKATYNAGMILFAATVLAFYFLGHRLGIPFALAVMAVAGIGFATQYAIPYAIIPDVVEYDYAENGVRREGTYYGIWTFMSKVGQSLALLAGGWVLALFGYVAGSEQTPLAKLGIRLLCGPIPALFFIAGVIVLSFYPITESYYAQIMEKIKKKEQAS